MSYRNSRPPQREKSEQETAPAAPPRVVTPVEQPVRAKRPAHSEVHPKRRPLKIVAALIVLALLIAGVGYAFMSMNSGAAAIDSSKYQAVFFTNGQVYFGKLKQASGGYMRLSNVYYLQNKDQSNDKTSPQSANKQDASDVELIKLGNEIHGPEDEMVIAKDQVLFFENLKPAGTVSKTIENYQQRDKQ